MNESTDQDSRLLMSMNIGNILIVVIFSLSLILDWFSIWIAILSSLFIWLIFANVLTDIAAKWKQKAVLIEKGISLHQYCESCGLRFSSNKTHCPKCGTLHRQKS